MSKNTCLRILCLLLAFLLCQCMSLSGGTTGSETGNAFVRGVVVDSSGERSGNAVVKLLPHQYNPLKKEGERVLETKTNERGEYVFKDVEPGKYHLYITDLGKSYGLGVDIEKEDYGVYVPLDTLRKLIQLVVQVPKSISSKKGVMYIEGTDVVRAVDGQEVVEFTGVPSTHVSRTHYVDVEVMENKPVGNNAHYTQGESVVIGDYSWEQHGYVRINTSYSGVHVKDVVTNIPVWVEIQDPWIFSVGGQYGKELSFSKQNGDPLPFDIKFWDPVTHTIKAWVLLDTILPNQPDQRIYVYEKTDSVSEVSLFEQTGEYFAVWHLDEDPNGVSGEMKNAAGSNNHGTSKGNLDSMHSVLGVAGQGVQIDGATNSVDVGNLAYGGTRELTLSAWVRPDSIASSEDCFQNWQVIAGSRVSQGGSWMKLQTCGQSWGFEYKGLNGKTYKAFGGGVHRGEWTYVSATLKDNVIRLYVNGEEVSFTSIDSFSHLPKSHFQLGRRADGGGTEENGEFLSGELDEVWLMKKGRSASWHRFHYHNIKTPGELLQWHLE